jgi:transcriptional regulator with XRE-family HTH domain
VRTVHNVHAIPQVSGDEENVLATLQLRPEGLAKIRKLAKIDTDKQLAEKIGLDPATVSRVLTGKSAPGPRFIAGLIDAFGIEWFADLFAVVPDDEDTAA